MLIIGRKVGESVVLDGGIELFITDIQGDRVRIGIEAPKEIKVIRRELLDTKNANVDAAAGAPSGRAALQMLSKALREKKLPE